MRRKQALVVAAAVALVGASGLVAGAAVTGANILGFHVSSPFKTASADGATTSTVADTEPPTTPAPVYVVTTELYDEFIVVPTPPPQQPVAAAPAAPAPYAPYAADDPVYDQPADPGPQPTAPATAPAPAPTAVTTEPTVATTSASPAPTTAATAAPPTQATTTTTRATTVTTWFDPTGPVPAGFSVPSNLKLAAAQTPLPPGGPFLKCQFEDNHTWNCEK